MPQTKERLLHHVTISVFSKPYDDSTRVLQGLDVVSPVSIAELLALDKEYDPERPHTIHYRGKDIVLTVQETDIDEGRMTIYALFFRKMHDVNLFAKKLVGAMTALEREEYNGDPTLLLDEEGHLICRLDKELLMNGKWSLTDDGNCYKVKASIAAYPRTEERIVRMLRRILTVQN